MHTQTHINYRISTVCTPKNQKVIQLLDNLTLSNQCDTYCAYGHKLPNVFHHVTNCPPHPHVTRHRFGKLKRDKVPPLINPFGLNRHYLYM